MTDLLFERIDQLVPDPMAEGNWDDVLLRAGQTTLRRSLRPRRRTLVVVSVVAVAIVLFATPAFGLRSALLDLIGRTDVPFSAGKSAPNRVKKQYLDLETRLASGAFAHRFGVLVAAEAREVGAFTINGHSRRLWVVPTRKGGGFCYTFEKASGGCNDGSAAQRKDRPLSMTWLAGGGPRLRIPRGVSAVIQVSGTITATNAAQLQVLYADGTRSTIPFVWVSRPIAAGFFAYDIPKNRLIGSGRPTAFVLTDRRGKLLARDAVKSGNIEPVFPRPQPVSHRAFVPAKLPTSPSPPLQRGTGDGTSVLVGGNGFVVFDTRGTPLDRFSARRATAMYSCFRITKAFGIAGVAGGNASGASPQRARGDVRVYLNTAGPFDGCEASSEVGHTWPDRLGSHAAVEIPLTPRGRLYFTDRAAARDLALFIHSARLRDAWTPGGTELVTRLTAKFGTQLTQLASPAAPLAPGRVGYSLVPNGATFVETSPTGKRFAVTIAHRWITHQNLDPYTRAYLFWKRS
jgi:hypothetical protein